MKIIQANEKTKTIIMSFFIASVIAANVVTAKILKLGPFIVPGGVAFYAVTFLCTDFLSEMYGKKAANDAVMGGFFASIFVTLMYLFVQVLPVAPFSAEIQTHYVGLLGTNYRFVFASMVAYLTSQKLDVWLFHKIGMKTKGKHKWLRNNVATMISQIADTVIYIAIAFGFNENFIALVVGQYVVKFIIALLDTPVFYLITRGHVQEDFLESA